MDSRTGDSLNTWDIIQCPPKGPGRANRFLGLGFFCCSPLARFAAVFVQFFHFYPIGLFWSSCFINTQILH